MQFNLNLFISSHIEGGMIYDLFYCKRFIVMIRCSRRKIEGTIAGFLAKRISLLFIFVSFLVDSMQWFPFIIGIMSLNSSSHFFAKIQLVRSLCILSLLLMLNRNFPHCVETMLFHYFDPNLIKYTHLAVYWTRCTFDISVCNGPHLFLHRKYTPVHARFIPSEQINRLIVKLRWKVGEHERSILLTQ